MDAVLAKASGAYAQDVAAATALLREHSFTVGHQLMPGLPSEDWDSLRDTTAAICRLRPDIARIYPVVVLADTELADMYRQGDYTPCPFTKGFCGPLT